MKHLIILTLLLLTINSFAKEKVGYLIGIDDGSLRNTTYINTTDLNKVVDLYLKETGMVLDTFNIFYDGAIYFQFRTVNKIFYCEMKKIIKGKYKPIRKKEKYIYAPKRRRQ